MNLYFSTNGINALEFDKAFSYVEPFWGQVGIEIFPAFHLNEFSEVFKKCQPRLKEYPISCHAPYYESEYSAAIGSAPYIRSMDLLVQTLNAITDLNTHYMVFHHNNHAFSPEEKETLLSNATDNFFIIQRECQKYHIPLVVENAGVKANHNMLLDEQEFINACKKLPCNVLIDIGHANANGWNVIRLMDALKDKIVSYHAHNNDGHSDGHQRIFHGTLDFEKFMKHYKEVTPNADIVLEYCPEAAADVAGVQEDISYILKTIH